jgi:hypothetical protein
VLPPVRATAAATPPDRDRLIDAIRGFSLVVVVVGHLAMVMVFWPAGGVPVVGNLLASYRVAQLLTWVLQVVPLFFMAGGAANLIAWRRADARGVPYSAWMWGRVNRLYRPVLVYFAVLAAGATVLTLTVGAASAPMLALSCQMLWFLGVYVGTTMMLPAMWQVHRRNRWLAFAVLVPLVTILNLGDMIWDWPPTIAFANFLLAWLTIQQLGFFWNEPTRRRAWAVVGATTFATNVLLVSAGPWPISLVGMPGEPVSNMAPPSIVLLLHGFTLVSLVYLARRPLERLLQRPRAWLAAVTMTMTAMTVYLWHIPAIALAFTTLHFLGVLPPTRLAGTGYPEPTSTGAYAAWWLAFLAVFSVYLVILVLLTWSTEYRPLPLWDAPARHGIIPLSAPGWVFVAAVVVGSLMISVTTLAISLIGFAGFPTRSVEWNGISLNTAVLLAVLLLGALLLRSTTRQPSTVPG